MNIFRTLLQEAQFHGSNRLIERRHRRWWAMALALSLWGACSIILATISRFTDYPAYLVITETADSMMEFPSVVLCPEINYPKYKVDAFLADCKYSPGFNETYIKSIIMQLGAFYSPDVVYSTKDLKQLEIFLDYNNISVPLANRLLSSNCEDSILRCRLFGVIVDCTKMFKYDLTNWGYCCIYNGRSLRREIETYGVHNAKPPPTLYSETVGFMSGLVFVVNSSQEIDDIDLTYKWLYVDKGQQFAESGRNGSPISANEEYWIGHYSHRFIMEHDMGTMSEEIRQCRMTTERLKYFPDYFRQYCLIECEMRQIMRRCHCVKLTHIRPRNWPYCLSKSLLCVKNVEATIGGKCDCPLPCDSTDNLYKLRSYSLVEGNYIIDDFYDGLNFSEVSVVRAFIFHHDNKINTRRSYYTSFNLFSQLGGTMNLFFGCSILTILELLQLLWYGVRQYWIVRQNRKQKSKETSQQPNAKKGAIKKKDKKKTESPVEKVAVKKKTEAKIKKSVQFRKRRQ